jgi:hypothetical protein
MSGGNLTIKAELGGVIVSRSEVLAWEARRVSRVWRKLKLAEPAGNLDYRRQALVEKKLELGHAGLEARLERELRWSQRSEPLLVGASFGRRRLCTVRLLGSGGSAEAMPAFYRAAMEAGDEASLLAACPDHYILHKDSEGTQRVIETIGGSPLAAQVLLDEEDTSTATTSPDPSFPEQWVAVGRNRPGGRPAGAIHHQFRDEPHGFTAILTGEFPAATPPNMIRAHRWHLACEFSNWIEAANLPGH